MSYQKREEYLGLFSERHMQNKLQRPKEMGDQRRQTSVV